MFPALKGLEMHISYFWIMFLGLVFIAGSLVGGTIIAACAVASNADDQEEREFQRHLMSCRHQGVMQDDMPKM